MSFCLSNYCFIWALRCLFKQGTTEILQGPWLELLPLLVFSLLCDCKGICVGLFKGVITSVGKRESVVLRRSAC